MRKTVFLLSLAAILSIQFSTAQEKRDSIISNPGLNKFTGHWQYMNGTDTITMLIVTHCFRIDNDHQLKVIAAYYNYKSGNSYIYKNADKFADLLKADFMGSTPYNDISLDSILVGGTDKLKRKNSDGVFVISKNNNRLQYRRGSFGCGLRSHEPGKGPLPGFTLPDSFTLDRINTLPEEKTFFSRN